MRTLPYVLLFVGIALAALFGGRLGPDHLGYRVGQASGAEIEALTPRARLADWASVGALGWVVGVGLIGVGAALARRQLALEHTGGADTEAAGVDFAGTLQRVRGELERLGAQLEELPPEDDGPAIREALDRIAERELEPLVSGRGQLVARHGLAPFALYFGPFSAGERKLARGWSALTDGHVGEARVALQEARQAFGEALDAWEQAEGRA